MSRTLALMIRCSSLASSVIVPYSGCFCSHRWRRASFRPRPWAHRRAARPVRPVRHQSYVTPEATVAHLMRDHLGRGRIDAGGDRNTVPWWSWGIPWQGLPSRRWLSPRLLLGGGVRRWGLRGLGSGVPVLPLSVLPLSVLRLPVLLPRVVG